jgi:signal transduction histidine kinase
LVGYTVTVGEPVVSEDVRDDPRFSISSLFAEASPVSAASVVMPGRLGAFGALVVASRTHRVFDTADVEFMQAVANVVGVAIERAKLDEKLEAAREAERTRIARELHDDGLRELTDALGIVALGLSGSLGSPHEQRWADVAGRLQRLGRQLRSAIYDLGLGTDEDRAFRELVEDLVALQSAMAVASEVRMRGSAKLPPESLGHRGTEILRMLREAITNARAHSGAETIALDAGRSTADVLRFDVTDDGRWPDRDSDVTSRRGTGIIGMFERAAEVDAGLRIDGLPGGGTRISVELPLRPMEPAAVDNQPPASRDLTSG